MKPPDSWRNVSWVFLRKLDAEPKKRTKSDRAIALTSVMSELYVACVVSRLER